MSRNGKIARLPEPLREELNSRLYQGEPAVRLMDWLNSLPEVQAALGVYFYGRPLNQQNLTEWKKGGYQDWLLKKNAQPRQVAMGQIREAFRADLRRHMLESLAVYWLNFTEALEKDTNRSSPEILFPQGDAR